MFAVVLVYLLIMALKLQRLEREVDELAARVPDEEAAEAALLGPVAAYLKRDIPRPRRVPNNAIIRAFPVGFRS